MLLRRRPIYRRSSGFWRFVFRVLVLVLIVAVVTVAAGLWWSLPPKGLQARLPGLDAPVHITLDADGIPLIRAESDRDAATAIGFLHARDRMFQMDLTRRE